MRIPAEDEDGAGDGAGVEAFADHEVGGDYGENGFEGEDDGGVAGCGVMLPQSWMEKATAVA
jgi:hypothetical protein